jgi:hypothetical protein
MLVEPMTVGLASHFLRDVQCSPAVREQLRVSLAESIQRTVEDWFADLDDSGHFLTPPTTNSQLTTQSPIRQARSRHAR